MWRSWLLAVAFSFLFAGTSAALGNGQSFGGVVVQSSAQAMNFRDQSWNAGDNTGNSSIDGVLDMIANKVNGNPAAISALEEVAFDVKMSPMKFVAMTGEMRADVLRSRLKQAFASVGGYDVDVLWPKARRA